MANLRQTPLTCSGHTRPVVHLAFSDITESSYLLISASKDGKPMLRQGDTGDWIGTFEGHKGAVWGVAINKEATKAASGAADFNAKIWDALTGGELLSIPHKHIVKSVHFSTDSTHLATGSNEKLLRIWDLNKPFTAVQEFAGHTGGIRQMYYFRNDTRLVSCSDDKTVRVWDVSSGKEVEKLEFQSVPNSIEVSPDGQVITVVSGYNVSFWDSESLTKINEFTVPTPVNSASLHMDKTIFVCGGDDFKMYKMDYKTGQEIESFKGHFGPVHCVRFSPDGELYASGSEDGTLRLWQTTVGKTYGLWKCIESTNNTTTNNSDQQNNIQQSTLQEVVAN
ncbi:serine-threonine kinase receptor-associated protein [Cimex lectularius]|uniref:Serine-threonine kinase receptor-associated protein n=1 Tax=Cimex lectularius TaxID=79782 RepID=A0A8I6SB25_CIMLE|nr:serine-threonine kinase receptor-associated protein [Cimex lectularius]